MKKLYFIVPIVGTIIFFFFFSAVKNDIKLQDEQREKDAAAEMEARTKADVENRKKAFASALAEANRRIAEIKKKEAEEARKAEETQNAKDARDLAYRERERQFKHLQELTDNRTTANEQLARVQEQLALQKIQSDYLGKTVKDIVQTKNNYEQALGKMEAAAAAAETAARAAAAAAARRG